MDLSARRFARMIIAIHVLLLAAVVGVVILATREIHRQSLQQAMNEAAQRQELLSRQTATGISAFYSSIADNLDLGGADEAGEPLTTRPFFTATRPIFPRTQPSTAATSRPVPVTRPAALPPMPKGLPLLLWDQLQRRASHFLSIEREPPSDRFPSGEIRLLGGLPRRGMPEARAILEFMHDWLMDVARADVSRFRLVGAKRMSLVSVTTPAGSRRNLVAVVPIDGIRKQFLSDVAGDTTAAMLLDEDGQVMVAAGNPALCEQSFTSVDLDRLSSAPSHTVTRAGGDQSHRRSVLTTAEPVPLLSGIAGARHKRWWVIISTDSAQVEAVVNGIFRRTIYSAVFVVAAVTLLLLSTAVLLIRSRVRLERERHALVQRELEQARRIQLAWLPDPLKGVRDLDVAALNQPANHISGDFYDWFELPETAPAPGERSSRRIVVTIGDVTGHGMSAAFLMATTQLLLRTTMMRVGDPARCLEEVNRHLCVQVFNGQFVTVLVMVIEPATGRVEVASAGHFPPMACEAGQSRSLPLESQLVLGVEREVHFTTERFDLSPGAGIVLYTDGVVDVRSMSDERFAAKRLSDALAAATGDARGMLNQVADTIDRFRGNRELIDDLTMVAIRLPA